MPQIAKNDMDAFVEAFVNQFLVAVPDVNKVELTKLASATFRATSLSTEELVKLALAKLAKQRSNVKQAAAASIEDIKAKYPTERDLAAVGLGIFNTAGVVDENEAAACYELQKRAAGGAAVRATTTALGRLLPRSQWGGYAAGAARSAAPAAGGAAARTGRGLLGSAGLLATGAAGGALGGSGVDYVANYNNRLRGEGVAEANKQFSSMLQSIPQETLFQNPALLYELHRSSQTMNPEYKQYMQDMLSQWLQNMAAYQQYNAG